MNKKQREMLAAIFEKPTRRDMQWSRVEALIVALGGTIRKSKGSHRVATLNGYKQTFQEPHGGKQMLPYAVQNARDLIDKAGLGPE